MMVTITKTDYLTYLHCPESFWLMKRRPEEFPGGERSLFMEKLIKEGYEVEGHAQGLFPGAKDLGGAVLQNIPKLPLKAGIHIIFKPLLKPLQESLPEWTF